MKITIENDETISSSLVLYRISMCLYKKPEFVIDRAAKDYWFKFEDENVILAMKPDAKWDGKGVAFWVTDMKGGEK